LLQGHPVGVAVKDSFGLVWIDFTVTI